MIAAVRVATRDDGRVEAEVRVPTGQWLRLHSAYDPQQEAAELIERTLDGRPMPPVAVAIGCSRGHVIDALVRRRPDVRVIALDWAPAFLDGWTPHQAASTAGRVVTGFAPAFELPVTAWPAEALAGEPLVVVHPLLARHWPGEVARARAAAEQYLYERRANEEARQRLAPVYLEHTLRNLPVLASARDVTALDGAARGHHLVLCGAGPSLDKMLPALQRARGRSWLVALDTALHPLLAAGVVPHLVVSIDPTVLNGRHLLDLPTRTRPWLVAEASLDPRAFRAFAGRIFACRLGSADPWPWLSSIGIAVHTVRAWGSVLTAACDVVRRMQPAHVAFAGMDLAYTSGQPYCRGTRFEGDWEAQRQRDGLASIEEVWRVRLHGHTVQEPDAGGSQVATARQMVAFRNWVRTLIADTPACTFTNVTGGGILHGDRIAQSSLDAWLPSSLPHDAPEPILAQAAAEAPAIGGPSLADTVRQACHENEPWDSWAARVPRLARAQVTGVLESAARDLNAQKGTEQVATAVSEWIDVPFDQSQFFAKEPMAWRVSEPSVGTYAYKVDGRTMTVSFKINSSGLTGAPSNELFLRLPGGYLPARGAANAVWIGSRPSKEMGYVTVHPGLDVLVVHRANEEPFPLEDGDFFLFGQLVLEVQ